MPCAFALNSEPFEQPEIVGEIGAFGVVDVNGDPVASGTALFGISGIVTGWRSSAIVSLASKAHVELLPQSEIKLTIVEREIDCELVSGIVRISAPRGVSVRVSTKNGSVFNNPQGPVMFTVAATNEISFSRYSGELSISGGSTIHETPAPGFFRSAVTEPDLVRAAPVSASGAVNERLAVLFITVGTVLAAITGLTPARDPSFFRRGGS